MKYEIERMETIRSIFCLFEKSEGKTQCLDIVSMRILFFTAKTNNKMGNQNINH